MTAIATKPWTFAIVYQCSIANVFDMRGSKPKRIQQHAYSACEWFCRGLVAAGMNVEIYHCDKAGDIAGLEWERGAGDMFADAKDYA